MSRLITIDGVNVIQVRMLSDAKGVLHVFCEYQLTSAGVSIVSKHVEVTTQLSAGQIASAGSVFAAIVQGVNTTELG